MSKISIRELSSDETELAAAWPIMSQLRPALTAETFVAQVRVQMRDEGFRLVAGLDEHDVVRALAGFRVETMLHRGRSMYVDDLVTDVNTRSHGFGAALFDWLVAEARRLDCQELHLDSGVQRFDAHRFYLRQRMAITAHHFMLKLDVV